MIQQERLRQAALAYGITLTPEMLARLDTYAALLAEWNQRMNLTAIEDAQGMEEKHFIDSLLLAAQPEVQGTLVDVGSGAGFPGMVVKIYNPSVQVTLMEPNGKRCTFLRHLAEALQLEVDVVKERAEEAARKPWREQFDVATARAVAGLPALCEYCLPLVRPRGLFIAMKGAPEPEVQQAEAAMQKLGGKLLDVRRFSLPDGAVRSLVLVCKEQRTPKAYPRQSASITKKPL